MSDEYEGKLIQDLFSANNNREVIDVLEEMQQNASAVFKYPVLEVYKKYNNKSISHYFIITLTKLDIPNLTDIFIEIGNNLKTNEPDLKYIIQYFNDIKFYGEKGTAIAKRLLKIHMQDENVFYLELYSPVNYLINAGIGKKIEGYLQAFFLTPIYSISVRTYSLKSYLIVNPNVNAQWLIDNYNNILSNKGMEEVIAKVITNWNGSQIDTLKTIIKNSDNIKAKHIITEFEKKQEEEKIDSIKKKEESIQKTFSNADIIEKIVILRNEVNSGSRRNSKIGFEIFPQNESIIKHLIAANDKPNFTQICSELRDYITDFNKDINSVDSEFIDTEKCRLLPKNTATNDYKKSINRLFLFLIKRGFDIKNDVFGLRILNQLSNLGTHSNKEDQLIELLKKENIYDSYENEDFVSLHRILLSKYIDFLQNLLLSLKTSSD